MPFTSEFLRPVRKTKISDDIYHQIISYISRADLKPGHKLPSERELSELFSTSRSAVREALRYLEALQIVEVHQGKGYFVKKFDYDAYIHSLSLSISMMQVPEAFTLSEFWEARKRLESVICVMAAERMDDAKGAELQDNCRKMEESIEYPDQFARLSAAFHRDIAKMTGNKVLVFLLDCLLTIHAQVRRQMMSRASFRHQVLQWHKHIVKLFLEKDPAKVGEAMNHHLDVVDQSYGCSGNLRSQSRGNNHLPPEDR